MEIYEKINIILKERRILKKEFVQKLLLLEPKLKRTGEIPSEQTIYSYLNGTINLKLELIPYIAEALDITEQELFDTTEKSRMKYLKYILNNPTKKEIEYIKDKVIINDKNNTDINTILTNEFQEIMYLLKYAPVPLLEKFKSKLKSFKKISDEF